MATFGNRLRELMREQQVTAAQLAVKFNTQPSKICRWYNHDKDVSLSVLISLSKHFQCSIEYLCGRLEVDEPYIEQELPPFGQRLSQIMTQHNISQYRLAKDGILSQSQIYSWQRGSQPRLSSLIRIADYLQCTIDYLVGR